MKHPIKIAAAIVLLVTFLTGCAMLTPQLPQTPRDKASVFMSYYMAQLKDYNDRYTSAQLSGVVVSELERDVLEAKYEFLIHAWEPIAMYDSYVTAGTIPPATLEAKINGLIGILEDKLRKEGRGK